MTHFFTLAIWHPVCSVEVRVFQRGTVRMRDLSLVLASSALMALLLLVVIPGAVNHAMPKANSPAAVIFASSQLIKVSYRDTDASMIVH
jgi:hypothetical protein